MNYVEEDALLDSRRASSTLKKGMFLPLERPLLDWRRASSSMEKGVSSKREGRSCWNILTVSIFLNSVSSLTEYNSFSHGGHFFFSQSNTEEQNTQGFTETLSQPISQNVTTNIHHPTPLFGSNVLWYLYAGGVLWVRNSAQKGSVRSVSSVREKTRWYVQAAQ